MLPTPSPDALAHSQRVVKHLQERIQHAGGWMSFAQYMEAVLYAPGLGYYSAGATKLGAAGDFVTAPEISPLFARCLSRQCAEVLHTMDAGELLEFGAGRGVMARDILLELAALNALPNRYLIVEVSADL